MLFSNRSSAGKELAERLVRHLPPQADWAESNLVVVGLPRGGVPVALEVARKFRCPLEIIVAKKIHFPGQPEYAIGAVSSDGVVVLNPNIPDQRPWKNYIKHQSNVNIKRTADMERSCRNRAGHDEVILEGKTIVIVDDGIATGMTAKAALETAKRRGAARTILATPVMSIESYRELRSDCDDIVALRIPHRFTSVGRHYLNFDQKSSQEVVYAPHYNNCVTDGSVAAFCDSSEEI